MGKSGSAHWLCGSVCAVAQENRAATLLDGDCVECGTTIALVIEDDNKMVGVSVRERRFIRIQRSECHAFRLTRFLHNMSLRTSKYNGREPEERRAATEQRSGAEQRKGDVLQLISWRSFAEPNISNKEEGLMRVSCSSEFSR